MSKYLSIEPLPCRRYVQWKRPAKETYKYAKESYKYANVDTSSVFFLFVMRWIQIHIYMYFLICDVTRSYVHMCHRSNHYVYTSTPIMNYVYIWIMYIYVHIHIMCDVTSTYVSQKASLYLHVNVYIYIHNMYLYMYIYIDIKWRDTLICVKWHHLYIYMHMCVLCIHVCIHIPIFCETWHVYMCHRGYHYQHMYKCIYLTCVYVCIYLCIWCVTWHVHMCHRGHYYWYMCVCMCVCMYVCNIYIHAPRLVTTLIHIFFFFPNLYTQDSYLYTQVYIYTYWSKEIPPPGGVSYLLCSPIKNRV